VSSAAGLAPLPRAFYARPTVDVAHALLGKLLVRRPPSKAGLLRVARIVEVEAYLGVRDAASHARRGPTPRAAIMFGPPGFLYVYLIYGMHNCMNVITETDGVAGAVLLRAAAPVAGVPGAWTEPDFARRSPSPGGAGTLPGSRRTDKRPLTGPGKLCAGLDITRLENGLDLTAGGNLYLADDGAPPPRRAASARIGVDYAGAWAARKLRFYVRGDPYVSKG
jgi:DNA-3-methyladenine glycosylase